MVEELPKQILPVVGVINHDNEMANLMVLAVTEAGFCSAVLLWDEMESDPMAYERFLLANDPKILVVHTPMPYQTCWPFIEKFLKQDISKDREIVHVTDNVMLFNKTTGQIGCELINIPCDFDNMILAIQRAHLRIQSSAS